MNSPLLTYLIIAAGIGQIFTAIIYPFIRHRVFDWYNDIKQLKPLNQEIAKTYGHYIQGLNFAFGAISILCVTQLTTPSVLALALSGLIGAYWVGKVITQITYYPMYQIPQQPIFKIGSYGMNFLFVLFACVFTVLFILQIKHLVL